jgi:hypothetical protein
MKAMKPLRILALFAVLAIAWWMWRPRAPLDAPRTDAAPPAVALPAPPPQTPPTQPAREAPATVENGATDAAAPVEPEALAPVALRLRGAVVNSLDGAGAPGIVVHLTSPRGRDHGAKSTPSDALGAFQLELRGDEWKLGGLHHALAVEVAGGRRRFDGLVRLDQDFTLELDELTRLHGIVIAPEWARDQPISLAAFTPPVRGGETHRWMASAKASASGEFEMYARLPALADLARIQIAVGELSTVTYDVALDDLASDVGAEFVLELNVLRVRVFDSHGAPQAGAQVRIASLAEGPHATPAAAETDANGLAQFTRPPGEIELCVGAPGHRSVVDVLAFDGGDLDYDVNLEALEQGKELFGVVLLDTNEPAPDAYVAVGPTTLTRDLSVAATSGVRTDEHGEFRISAASSGALELTAFHRDWGMSEPQLVEADGRRLVVWLPRTGKLRVDVLTDAAPGPFRTGGAEYVLRHRGSGAIESGDAASLPLELEELVAGEYDVYVLLEGFNAVAEGFARVEAGRLSSSVLAARAANWIDGRVTDSSGEGAWGVNVTARGRWPAEVSARLCTSPTDFAGRFRVLSADRGAELVVYDAEAEWARQIALAGEFSAVELP